MRKDVRQIAGHCDRLWIQRGYGDHWHSRPEWAIRIVVEVVGQSLAAAGDLLYDLDNLGAAEIADRQMVAQF